MTTSTCRVGLGYDVHRLVPGRQLVLGGVVVPASFGLEGHSDADVLLHALMDALLGAAGQGDIGVHFSPGEDRWRGVSSLVLLDRVGSLVREQGWQVVNVDCTVVLERPRLLPYVAAMKAAIGPRLALDEQAIGIKATTNEGLGFVGREEGIAAMAVALLGRVAAS